MTPCPLPSHPLPCLDFQVDIVLDKLKHKGAVKRVLFLHSRQSQYSKNMTVSNGRAPGCEELVAYLIVSMREREKEREGTIKFSLAPFSSC